jgi:hypothetical protein
MRYALIGLMVMVVACRQAQARPVTSPTSAPSAIATLSPSPVTNPSETPSTKPTPLSTTAPSKVLFAVLETKGTAKVDQWNTVAIAGLDGYARAKATFAPMPVPALGCMGAVLPLSAHVAAGKVFYADAKGVVRSLAVDGTVATAATFPLTSSQQMLSFAVSPDGSHLLGAVFTVPAKPNLACGGSPAPSGYSLDVYTATAGGPSTILYHRNFSSHPASVMAFTGWDRIGPVGTYPTVWASQGGGPGSELGVAVRIDASTGQVLRQLADPSSCLVWDSIQSGAFACTLGAVQTTSDPWGPVSQPVSIRNAAGQQEWRFTVTSVNGANSPRLAPDEQHVVICCNFATASNWVVDTRGHQTLLKTGFYAAGWLNATTLVGFSQSTANSPGLLSYVALKSPANVVSMGFTGQFVGTVAS